MYLRLIRSDVFDNNNNYLYDMLIDDMTCVFSISM